MVGYEKVRELAVQVGFNHDMLATPALALGAYVATPLEVAGAYTVFANGGDYVSPGFIMEVRDSSGRIASQGPRRTRAAVDPRVAYLMVSLMQSVVNNGTAAEVRSRGFSVPAAGKTGTSHDGWFAGFTTNLLAIAWVGYDDDRDIRLSGAQSALPIWTEFMKRAIKLPTYENAREFLPPAGIVTAEAKEPVYINPKKAQAYGVSVQPGAPNSLAQVSEIFIEGTEPREPTVLQDVKGGISGLFHKVFGSTPSPVASAPEVVPGANPRPDQEPASNPPQNAESGQPPQPEKKGAFRKLLGVFKGGSKD
jgi:penicillin-binding protein 1B